MTTNPQNRTMAYKLIQTIAFAIFAFIAINIVWRKLANGNYKNKVVVDVYYEHFCSGSQEFITQFLRPAYKDLKNYIHVNFIPFGLASYVVGHPTKFICQHGPEECNGNRAQACALHAIDRFVDVDDQQQKAVDVVTCVMATQDPFSAILECAKKNGLDEKLQDIKACIKGDLGDAMLISYGDKTKAFNRHLHEVPTVAIDGVQKAVSTFSNFIGEICKVIEDNEKPAICKSY